MDNKILTEEAKETEKEAGKEAHKLRRGDCRIAGIRTILSKAPPDGGVGALAPEGEITRSTSGSSRASTPTE